MADTQLEQRELIRKCMIDLADTEYGPAVTISINDKHFVSTDAESMWKLAASIMIQVRKLKDEQGIANSSQADSKEK